MGRKHAILVGAVALLAAAFLCGCERTAENSAAENADENATATASCSQGTQSDDPLCAAAGEDCAGCPAMETTGTAQTEPETHTCPHAADGMKCPEGCTSSKVEADEGEARTATCPGTCGEAETCPKSGEAS